MKIFNHTIYAPTKIDRHEKTSVPSVPSVVDTYQYGYRVNIYSGSESSWTIQKDTKFVYNGWNLIQEQTTSGSDVSLTNSAFTQFRTSNYTYIADKCNDEGVKISNGNGLEEALYKGFAFELIDTAGVVVAHYEYSPFGKLTKEILNSQFVINNSFKFSTKYLDNETGLNYYGLRYYNPETGRWINRDPIGERGGLNLYGFINNSVYNFIDQIGLSKYKFGQTVCGPWSAEYRMYMVFKKGLVRKFGFWTGKEYYEEDWVKHYVDYQVLGIKRYNISIIGPSPLAGGGIDKGELISFPVEGYYTPDLDLTTNAAVQKLAKDGKVYGCRKRIVCKRDCATCISETFDKSYNWEDEENGDPKYVYGYLAPYLLAGIPYCQLFPGEENKINTACDGL